MAQTTRNQRPRPSQRPQARGSGGGGRGGGSGPTGGGGGRGRQRGRQPAGFPWIRVAIPAAVVLVVAIILIIVSVGGGSSTSSGGFGPADASVAPAGVAAAVQSVPASVYNTVGVPAGLVSAPVVETGQPVLTSGGKPEVYAIFEEWCPYCAAARWSVATALARLGSFSNLKVTQSSSSDVYPDTNTLSYYHAGYSSPTLAFVVNEEQNPDRQNIRGETPTAAETRLEAKYDAQGSVPFIDIGNKYIFTSTYNPQVLQGLSWGQIAADLDNPKSTVTQSVIGAANLIDAAVCKITNGAPAAVCTSPAVKEATAVLNTAGSSSTGSSSTGSSSTGSSG